MLEESCKPVFSVKATVKAQSTAELQSIHDELYYILSDTFLYRAAAYDLSFAGTDLISVWQQDNYTSGQKPQCVCVYFICLSSTEVALVKAVAAVDDVSVPICVDGGAVGGCGARGHAGTLLHYGYRGAWTHTHTQTACFWRYFGQKAAQCFSSSNILAHCFFKSCA